VTADILFAPAFTLWGSPTTWLELVAVVVALAMVGCNIREKHWGWPLAIISSADVLWSVLARKLYGEAGLQVFFAVMALWGWFQWLRGMQPDGAALRWRRLAPRPVASCAGLAVLWPATGLFLRHFTDTDVPWWDAFPTA
jgi:nicotinamide mononucleotide transporter